MSHDALRYLKRSAIDTVKWDRCVDHAPNGVIYANSGYLDIMARNWDALVLGDYEAVMPLSWNSKWGISYLYQPPYTATLGIFGHNLNEATIRLFLENLPTKFKLVEMDLNPGNVLSPLPGDMRLRTNYILSLEKEYATLQESFRENIRRNVKKAQELHCRFSQQVPVTDILELAQSQLLIRRQPVGDSLQRFKKLYAHLTERKQTACCGVYTPGGELLASAVFFFSHQRAYYILPGNHPNGRVYGASHFLVDRFIASYAGTSLKLDFEGSDIPSLAYFYSGFGATPETYPALHRNRLPQWIRWLKR